MEKNVENVKEHQMRGAGSVTGWSLGTAQRNYTGAVDQRRCRHYTSGTEARCNKSTVCASCCPFLLLPRGNIFLEEALYFFTVVLLRSNQQGGQGRSQIIRQQKKPGILPFHSSSVNFLKEALAPAPVKKGKSKKIFYYYFYLKYPGITFIISNIVYELKQGRAETKE